MLCTLATLVAVPVLLSSGASSDGVEVAAVAVENTTSAADLESELELDELFTPGARVDDVMEAPAPSDPSAAAVTLSQAVGDSVAFGTSAEPVTVEPQRSIVDQSDTGDPDPDPEPLAETPQQVPPTTQAPVTTQPPTTAAPTTTAPPATTAAPETTEAPVVEAPQGAAPDTTQPPSQPTPEQWAALRQCEASGSYTIVSSNGLYHGAYQFFQPTWDGLARQLGRADLVGLPPSQAAPADQDALALLLWQQRGGQPWPVCGRHLPPRP